MKVKRTSTSSRIIRIFVPAVLGLLMLAVAVNALVVYQLTHPVRTQAATNPTDYLEISNVQLPWSEEEWSTADNTRGHGWLLHRGAGSPAIVLSHGYGANRGDLLDLGVDLWRAGFTVLLYDLRGHGESPVDWTSLGDYEVEDLLSAIKHLKTVKDARGAQLIDPTKVGLYGVSLGGYASLVAASRDSAVRAVVADSVFPSSDAFARVLTRQSFRVSNRAINKIVDWGLWANFPSHYGANSAIEAVRNYQGVRLLLIAGPDSAELRQTTGLVYTQATDPREITEVAHSRLSRLYGAEQTNYNQLIVEFFKRGEIAPAPVQAKN